MKRRLLYVLPVFMMLIFVLLPFPASKLYIRVFFENISEGNLVLYYSTDNTHTFLSDQCLISDIDHESQCVEFCFDASFEGKITALRLDFPNETQLVGVKTITVSSAGVVKQEFNPCDFFSEDNVVLCNSIDSISLVKPRARAYVDTLNEDPWIMLSDKLCQQIMGCYSHFRFSRILVCVFFAACLLVSRKKLFTETFLPGPKSLALEKPEE